MAIKSIIDKKLEKIFLFFIIIFSIFLIGFLYFQNKKTIKKITNLSKNQASTNTSGSSATLLNWRDYADMKNGYQIFYPSSWKIDTTVPSYLQLIPPNEGENEEGRIIIVVEKETSPNVDQFMEKINPATGTKNKEIFLKLAKIQNEKEEGLLTKGGCCGLFGRHVFFIYNHKLYQITLKASPDSTAPKNEDVFKKIVSSFKFLD